MKDKRTYVFTRFASMEDVYVVHAYNLAHAERKLQEHLHEYMNYSQAEARQFFNLSLELVEHKEID